MKTITLTLITLTLIATKPARRDTVKKVIDKPGVYWPADKDTTINWNHSKQAQKRNKTK